MADGSEMMTQILYILLIVVMAIAGWYMGIKYDSKYIGAAIGALIGVGVVVAINNYNTSRYSSSFY